MYKLIFMILVFLILSISCDDAKDESIQSTQNIVGSWNWTQSDGGIAGTTETPDSVNESRTVVFDDQGNVTFYTNNVATSSSKYTLEESDTIFSDTRQPFYKCTAVTNMFIHFPLKVSLN